MSKFRVFRNFLEIANDSQLQLRFVAQGAQIVHRENCGMQIVLTSKVMQSSDVLTK